jgi:diguanylate cyclase (GGDEF)-like protein/PAS domain S-box-containing protein
MDVLNLHTVIVGSVTTGALSILVMASLWRQNRERSPEIALWLVQSVLVFIGMALLFLRGTVPAVLSIVLAEVLVAAGMLALYQGLGTYVGKKSSQLHNYAIIAVSTLVLGYFAFVQPSLPARDVTVSLLLLIICAQGAWLMLKQADPELLPATRPTGIVFGALCLASIGRLVGALFWRQPADLFTPNVDSLAYLVYQMLFVSMTFALSLMVSRRLRDELTADIARRTEVEEDLRRSEEMLSAAFHTVPDVLLITRFSDGQIVQANESGAARLGFSDEEMLGKTTLGLGIWAEPADRERFLAELAIRGEVSSFESDFRQKDGTVFPGFISGQMIEADGQRLIMNVIHDGTSRRLAVEQLEELSSHDALTGILNYRAFYSVASERIAAARDSNVALIYMDLDRLKEINDTSGHLAGDAALVLFAAALSEGFRESDVIGRLGGDEFAVLAVQRDEVPDQQLMRRFEEALRDKNRSAGLPIDICASAGIVWWDSSLGAADLQRLIGAADARMYEAKRLKRTAATEPEATAQGSVPSPTS